MIQCCSTHQNKVFEQKKGFWGKIPPARPYESSPMNHVKYLRAGPAEMPFQTWYTANTNHFRLTDFCKVEIKNTTVLSNKPSTA